MDLFFLEEDTFIVLTFQRKDTENILIAEDRIFLDTDDK